MVWSAGQGSPGDDAFSFIGISKKQVSQMPAAARQATARSVRSTILAYQYWRDVLRALNLEPLTLDLPPVEAVQNAPDTDWGPGGESEHHKRLKMYLASHYKLLGLKGRFLASFEVCLPSGDKIDLMLDGSDSGICVCIEVKSRISNEEDLIRGIFQCIKYRAVLDAQERYELKRDKKHVARTFRVALVTECSVSPKLRNLSDFLGIEALTVRVPDDYRLP
jgi:hypothetical protein